MPSTEEEATQDLVDASKAYHALIMEAIEGRIVPRSEPHRLSRRPVGLSQTGVV